VRADDLEAIVLVGPGNPHAARLATAASKCRAKVRLIENPPDIPGLMGWCDVAVTAGGGTLWELGYFGIPCLVLVVAPNQEPCARLLHNQQACRVLGEADALDSASLAEEISTFLHDAALRAALGQRFAALVDGRGGQRVCDAMCVDKAEFAT
jgi:spore coat polysaccharide biosynthesis predicted glycosyltransferase SpsG